MSCARSIQLTSNLLKHAIIPEHLHELSHSVVWRLEGLNLVDQKLLIVPVWHDFISFQFRNQYDNDVTVWSPQVAVNKIIRSSVEEEGCMISFGEIEGTYLAHPPPVNRQTPVKTLPSRNFVYF